MKFPGSLHNHTDYSNIRLRDSINRIDTLIDYAAELNYDVIAITDHECLSSLVKVEEYYESKKKTHPNLKVIRGNEIYLTRNNISAANFNKENDSFYHFILLSKDLIGYNQLCKLSTKACEKNYFVYRKLMRVPTYYKDLKEVVGTDKGHLIGSTACLGGQLPKFLLRYRNTNDVGYLETAKKWCLYMVDIFGEGNFFLELQPSYGDEQVYVNKMLLSLSEELGIPYIITMMLTILKRKTRTFMKRI